jgi:hypothetical protein
MLPNAIVIGAAKCGTTSLHEYLDLHPEIAMSREKELNFFVAEQNWSRGLAWYEAQFGDAPIRGESSPAYTVHPLRPGVPERMSATIPGVRLVYLVRDPIDRIVSNYLHRSVNRPEMGTLHDALADPHVREWLVMPSCYWLQLEEFLRYFPREQILVVDSDDLRRSRQQTLAAIFAFLGAAASYRVPGFDRTHNVATGRVRRTRIGETVSDALEHLLGPSRSQALRERVPSSLKSPFRYDSGPPVLGEGLRTALMEELSPQVSRLRAETGLAFSGWSL